MDVIHLYISLTCHCIYGLYQLFGKSFLVSFQSVQVNAVLVDEKRSQLELIYPFLIVTSHNLLKFIYFIYQSCKLYPKIAMVWTVRLIIRQAWDFDILFITIWFIQSINLIGNVKCQYSWRVILTKNTNIYQNYKV